MKKILILPFLIALSSTAVLAQYGMMGNYDGYGMMGGLGFFGAALLGLVYLAIASLVFSTVFWLTHNWLVKEKKR